MNKKQIIRLVSFLVLTFALMVTLCGLFEFENSLMSQRLKTYKSMKKDTVDAVYIGSSATDRYWIAAKAYADYGMTVYPLSTDGQPVWLIKNMMKEAVKGQSPKLFIIDVRSFIWEAEDSITLADTRSRRVIDELPFFSLNRLSAINRTQKALYDLSRANDIEDDETSRFDISYFFSFIRYHSKWNEEGFSFSELKNPGSKYLGFYMAKKNSIGVNKIDAPADTQVVGELDKINAAYLYELIDYIKDTGADVLFVDSPRAIKEITVEENNAIRQTLDKEGMPYIFYSYAEMWEKYPYDTETDFYDNSHVNYKGAIKYTDTFAAYLHENYDLPDRRNDPDCESWNGVYDEIMKTIGKWENQ